ncbi:hypothetical protein [Massilia sp. IC2-476]|uniref:hypothetical protein n=1 Tax=Massilia sp. IC2-476 TaxID=2887199 RepID=UPI001D107255|nr:hypothetical protein [Massilia sp. IC2-476]MCC2974514.1 hypothetical protein [Massilia sp. IC2-476]
MPRIALATSTAIMRKAASIGAAFLFAVFAVLCLSKARLIGDGMEYLTMAQGFVAHASPELRQSDVDAIGAMPPGALTRGGLPPQLLADTYRRVAHDTPIDGGYARARDGSVHAIHFWLYSLLAAPFYAVVTLLGKNPFMALVALNLAILAAGACCLRAWLPGTRLPELGLAALLGPLYYTVWIGPEVMAGVCVLLATLAALRRDPALAVLLAGLGASQNPSIAGLIPASAAYVLLLRRFPATALFAPRERGAQRWRAILLVTAGVVLAALPFVHNQALFGMPSIISRYYFDLALVTPDRLFSFLFDLNQGLVIGLPGLLSCAAIVALRLDPVRRRAWLLHLGLAILLMLGMALPTLAATNWNSGALYLSRYAYWTSMPILAVCLAGLVRLDARTRVLALVLAIVLQGLAGWQAYRGRTPAFIAQGRLASWVLDHAPQLYNPDPEIFLERERRSDGSMDYDDVVIHSGPDGPTKLMRFWSNPRDGDLCEPGMQLAADGVVTLASGWRYYNAPLRCEPATPGLRIVVGPSMPPILERGWSSIEGGAVWTDGPRSTLRIALPQGRRVRYLGLDGHYVEGVRASRLRVNGIDLGEQVLGRGPLALPAAAAGAALLEITLEHRLPARPANAPDQRALGFFLRGVLVEFEP